MASTSAIFSSGSEQPVRAGARKDYGILLLLGLFALGFAVARACLQSVVIDEADAYLGFDLAWPGQWYPAAANHVLNTLLIRFSVMLFGLNELTLRLPALLGAAIYIASAAVLSRLIAAVTMLRVCLFLCLVYNPFVSDYFVAARGYSLALGFLLTAIALFAYQAICGDARFRKVYGLASLCLGLSFSANFSFGLVDGLTLLAIFLWAMSRVERSDYGRLALFCFVPALLVIFVICGSILVNWPAGQLYWGSQSLGEMLSSLTRAPFPEPNPEYVNPLLTKWLLRIRDALAYGTLILIVTLTVTTIAQRSRLKQWKLALWLAAIPAATLTTHWLAFHFAGLRLPLGRTGLFFAPLSILALGALIMLHRHGNLLGRVQAGLATAVLALCAFYFCGSLRLDRFEEWGYNADEKQLYWVLTDLNKRCKSTDFVTSWFYPSALNFYRYLYHNTALPEFVGITGTLPAGRSVYVAYYPDAKEFIEAQGLTVLYHSDVSNSVVAVRGCH